MVGEGVVSGISNLGCELFRLFIMLFLSALPGKEHGH